MTRGRPRIAPLVLAASILIAGCAGPIPRAGGNGTTSDSAPTTGIDGAPGSDTAIESATPGGTTDADPPAGERARTSTPRPAASQNRLATPTQTLTPTPTPTSIAVGTPSGSRIASILRSGRAAVTIRDANGTLGIVNASVADTPAERYRGLSDAERLPNGTGMLFVYPEADTRTFVMREMDFPLDMVFVASNGTITVIHRAPVERDDDLTEYRGHARWVLEVPYGWTAARGIEVGDAVAIRYPDGRVAGARNDSAS